MNKREYEELIRQTTPKHKRKPKPVKPEDDFNQGFKTKALG